MKNQKPKNQKTKKPKQKTKPTFDGLRDAVPEPERAEPLHDAAQEYRLRERDRAAADGGAPAVRRVVRADAEAHHEPDHLRESSRVESSRVESSRVESSRVESMKRGGGRRVSLSARAR